MIPRPRTGSVGLSLALLLSLVPVAHGGDLTPRERRLTAAVDRHATAALGLLQRAVEINSGTLNPDGVRQVGRLFEPEFAQLGFHTRWVDGKEWQRAGHLIAERAGKRGARKVLLIGHLDTVFERDSPFQHFERLDDSTARGPGIIDMKGGDVVMLLALRALSETGALDGLSIQVILTGDEERNGSPLSLARSDLIAAADWADIAIGFEDGDGDPRHAVTVRRGATGWRLLTAGITAHSSQIFRDDIGNGAVFEAARVLAAFRDSLAGEPSLTLNPGLILGGTHVTIEPGAAHGGAEGKSNVIAESTFVAGDLRTLSIEQRESAKLTMQRIAAASPPHSTSQLTFEDGYPPLPPSQGNRRLLALYDDASRDLGLGSVTAVDPRMAGAADISFAGGRVEQALDGIGLRGDGGHTVRETADLRTLPTQAKRAALLLARLGAPPRRGEPR